MSVISLLTVDGDRLNHNLDTLAEIGKLPRGGVRRISFSPEDQLARHLVANWMREAGMSVRTDAAGNMIGTYPGKSALPAFATGSHIDTVPSAGRYDGTLGVLAGIEVVRTLHENHIRLNHPIEVIVFTDEEGSMIGSKAMTGSVNPDPGTYYRKDGTSIQTCLEVIEGDWETIHTARRTSDEIAAFIELHVEQGGVLEKTGTQVGVVEGIVSLNRFTITVLGRPNHAGTTPMHIRQDALVAASHIVLAVEDLAKNSPGDQVATVGMLNVSPNAANIVPGQVDLSLDMRDLSQEHVDNLVADLKQRLKQIAEQTGTTVTIEQLLRVEPTLANPHIQQAIAQIAQDFGLSYCTLPSRAGHDAQEIGRFTDMGMIFVPSIGGISHAEDEYTTPEQCTQGANILLNVFMRLDEYYSL
ncbi:MAG: Zn-dependent hydrolase [Elainellaceae cyanobacterium]